MYKKVHDAVRERYSKMKLEIDEQMEAMDHLLEVMGQRRCELRAGMETILKYELDMECMEHPDVFAGIVIEPDMSTVAKAVCQLEEDYPDKEFNEVCFMIGEGVIGVFDEDDVAVEDDIPYLCGPMFIVGMDEYGNLCTLTRDGIKDALDYLEMHTVKMAIPDDDSLEYSVFRLV